MHKKVHMAICYLFDPVAFVKQDTSNATECNLDTFRSSGQAAHPSEPSTMMTMAGRPVVVLALVFLVFFIESKCVFTTTYGLRVGVKGHAINR